MAAAKASPLQPRWCNKAGCDARIILAKRADTNRWVPYEETDRQGGTQEAAGCHVLVGDQAWRLPDLIEQFQAQFEISQEKAEELALSYPHHRPHFHIDTKES